MSGSIPVRRFFCAGWETIDLKLVILAEREGFEVKVCVDEMEVIETSVLTMLTLRPFGGFEGQNRVQG